MKGDFTRKTFDPWKHYSRVMMQQGRVQLDADHNEQAAILLHYLRALAEDLGGPGWAPKDKAAFLLTMETGGDFKISGGRFYVDGILCENENNELHYLEQEGFSTDDERVKKVIEIPVNDKTYVAYLDVWERHITHLQDDLIHEAALGRADSCTGAKVVWQVRLYANGEEPSEVLKKNKLIEEIGNLKEQMAPSNAESKKNCRRISTNVRNSLQH